MAVHYTLRLPTGEEILLKKSLFLPSGQPVPTKEVNLTLYFDTPLGEGAYGKVVAVHVVKPKNISFILPKLVIKYGILESDRASAPSFL